MEADELPCVDLTPTARQLVCPECDNLLLPPTSVCASGHTFCSACRLELDKCSTCDGTFLEHARNIPIEEICRIVGNMCPYSENGCNYTLSAALLPGHVSRCFYRKLDCPLNKIPTYSCLWSSILKVLVPHLMQCHGDLVSERNYIMSTTLQSDTKILIHKDEIFVYYKYHKDSEWFAIVQRVGCTALKFRSVFIIRSSQNKIESVNMTFPVTSIDESIDDVLEEGRSMILDDTVVDKFVESDELCMMVAVEEVG
jgi:hypothetical protein